MARPVDNHDDVVSMARQRPQRIAIGEGVMLALPIHDLSGREHLAGEILTIEKAAHEHTQHPIVLATPSEWTRHSITHQTMWAIEIGGEYCFYAEDLRLATTPPEGQYKTQAHPPVDGCLCNVIPATMMRSPSREWRRYPTPDCPLHRDELD